MSGNRDTYAAVCAYGGPEEVGLAHPKGLTSSIPRFSSVWQDTLCVLGLVARGRARVSVSASAAGWPKQKRVRDMQYVDHDDFAVAH